MTYFYVIANILLFSHILLALVGTYFYRKVGRALKVLIIFFVITALVETASHYMAKNEIHNIWLLNSYILIYYVLLSLVFSFWQKNHKIRIWLRATIPFYVVVWLTRVLFFGGFGEFDSFSYSLSSILLVIIALYTLVEFQLNSGKFNFKEPQFWVSAIVLISYGGSIILHALGPIPNHSYLTWTIRSIIFVIADLSFAACLVWNYLHSFSGPS